MERDLRDVEIARLEERMRALQEDMTELKDAINGGHSVPFDRSVRGRLHEIENQQVSSAMLQQALQRLQAQQEHRAEFTFTRREKLIGALLGVPGAVVSVLVALQLAGIIRPA